MRTAYLLTGKPRVGKTRAIKRIIENIGKERCGGFYTEEIHTDDEDVNDKRIGFRLVTLDGQSGILAHVASDSPLRLGRYGVNLHDLEAIGLTAIERARVANKLIVIDEIGPMQSYSEQFKKMLLDLLNNDEPLLATIALNAHPWLDLIKQHKGVELYELTSSNQMTVIDGLSSILMESTPTV
jgi:nucleoside-triphosphatase